MKIRSSLLVLVLASTAIAARAVAGEPARLYPLTVLSDNPTAYWRLDELSGNVAHDHVGGHDCLLTNVQLGAVGYSAADPDTAAGFGLLSSSDSYAGELDRSANGIANLDFSQTSGGNAEFSVEAWVKSNPHTLNAGIIAKGYGNGGEQFNLDTGSDTVAGYGFRFAIRDAGGAIYSAASTVVPDGQWHHLVGVCDEPQGAVHLYIDGVDNADGAVPTGAGVLATSGGAAPGTALVSIGSRTSSQSATSFNNQFAGTIDEVAIYGYALSPAQVTAHYQAGLTALRFTDAVMHSNSIVLSGAGGLSNCLYTLVVSTNIALVLTNWIAIATNSSDGNGRFSLSSSITPAAQREFYALQVVQPSETFWIPPVGAWLGAEVTNGINPVAYSNHEANIGRQLDILRGYKTLSNWTGLSTAEMKYLDAGRKLFLSFKPDPYWSNAVGVAHGGSVTVDAQLTRVALAIAALNPRKLMLCVWHEPQNDVGLAGTTNEYVTMWHNVRALFDANGATNVLWSWVVQGDPRLRNLLPGLWPGNSYVDWVGWDLYQSSASVDFVAKQLDMYRWLANNSTPLNNYRSKPWCWAEWGVGINGWYPTVADQTNTFNAISKALNSRLFPRVRYVAYFDTDAAPNASSAILPGAWASYSNLANSPYPTQRGSP